MGRRGRIGPVPVEPLSVPGLVLALAAVVIGLSKTSVGGFAALAVAAFAVYLPTKESTAAVVLLLLIGDVVGVARYRKAASWPLLRRLLPSVLPGVAVGAVFLRVVDDHTPVSYTHLDVYKRQLPAPSGSRSAARSAGSCCRTA